MESITGAEVSFDQPPSADQAPEFISPSSSLLRMSFIAMSLSLARLCRALMTCLTADHHLSRDILAAARRVMLAEAVLQHVQQTKVLLTHEALQPSTAAQHEIHHCGDAR